MFRRGFLAGLASLAGAAGLPDAGRRDIKVAPERLLELTARHCELVRSGSTGVTFVEARFRFERDERFPIVPGPQDRRGIVGRRFDLDVVLPPRDGTFRGRGRVEVADDGPRHLVATYRAIDLPKPEP